MQITDAGTTLHHTCFLVRDVEKTATALAQSGIGPWGVLDDRAGGHHGSRA